MKTGAISVCVVLGLFPSVALSESISELFPTDFDDVWPITTQASGHVWSGHYRTKKGDLLGACSQFLQAAVIGGSDYRRFFDGIVMILEPSEIAECRRRARTELENPSPSAAQP